MVCLCKIFVIYSVLVDFIHYIFISGVCSLCSTPIVAEIVGTFGSGSGSICLFFRGQADGSADPLHPGAHTLPICGRTHGLAAGAGCGEAAAVGGARPGFQTTECV